ncbi:MAG TPA: FKBP-type peptidyl-prolyl cis-trans isomerase [Parapedobacter sp.]|nr:FKBP-type peptidyl-prolyl cis-trans isomerase [Parapedobacter sp.]
MGSVQAQQGGNDGTPVLSNRADSVAYAFGASVARDLKSAGLETINARVLSQAIADIFAGKESPFEEMQERELIMETITEAQEQLNSRRRDEAKAFMETNKVRSGVMTTASGLQYEVIREGNGEKPSLTDTVTVHYKGQLTDGRVFDSSYDRGEPATFPLERVIEGWQEGLQLMPVGAQYRIFVPYELGYGERGAGQDIPPFSPLIFEVELVSVQPTMDAPVAVEEEPAK